jgi:nicotinamidase-related amidase
VNYNFFRVSLEGRKNQMKKFFQNRIVIIVLLFGSGFLLGGFGHRLYVIASPYLAKLQACPTVPTPSAADRQPRTGDNSKLVLVTRTYIPAGAGEGYTTERDGKYDYQQWNLNLNKTALVLIDVWADHPNDGWLARERANIKAKIVPLLALARKHNMIIIYSPNGGTICPDACPQKGEIDLHAAGINTTAAFHQLLQEKGIDTLLYAGYDSNWCLLNRPSGIFWMSQLDYNIILVRDATIAMETAETLDGEWANKVVINMIESEWGRSTTLADLQTAFGE